MEFEYTMEIPLFTFIGRRGEQSVFEYPVSSIGRFLPGDTLFRTAFDYATESRG
jgi:hypothetical protein